MPESYAEIIDMALGELVNCVCLEQQKLDKTLDERVKAQAKTAGEFEMLLNRLDADDRSLAERFIGEESALTAIRMEHLYIQGAKDFVLLMKKLGAL